MHRSFSAAIERAARITFASCMLLGPPAMAQELLEIHIAGKTRTVGFAKYETRIGEWATVVHKQGPQRSVWRVPAGFSSTKGRHDALMTGKYRLDATTSDGARLELQGLTLTIHGPATEARQGFLGSLIEIETGISDVAPASRVDYEYRHTLASSLEPGTAWQLVVEKSYRPNQPVTVQARARLTDGTRIITLNLVPENLSLNLVEAIEALEDGQLLCRRQGRHWAFRSDLEPDLKLALLGSIEALAAYPNRPVGW